ncbi:hypothetical protein AX17_005196 [Amanita inopinata Kibby_2008]|nr:hypothetical protein AX17_005196 [Amanita inopinata Kibby_2008]
MSLAAVVQQAQGERRRQNIPDISPEPQENAISSPQPSSPHHDDIDVHATPRVAHFVSPPGSPAARTGPPRSLSFAYSLPGSPIAPWQSPKHDGIQGHSDEGEFPFFRSSKMRGALEFIGPTSPHDRKGKRRETRAWDDVLNSPRRIHESPKEEKPQFDFSDKPNPGQRGGSVQRIEGGAVGVSEAADTLKERTPLQDAPSSPHSPSPTTHAKWGRLRSLLSNIVPNESHVMAPGPSVVAPHTVNITDELITGGLSTLMLRLWFERDEKDHRRIPVLLHRLRIRISDSLHPMHTSKAVFRIECEYANGAARWVIYRQLRDFLSLHAHYTVSNVYNHNVSDMPDFPKTTIPYLKFLRKAGTHIGPADFARLQREALEEYLICLMRAVMFHPSANRLSGFLEISALFMSLAHSGGSQYKAGFMKVEFVGNGGSGFGRKSTTWRERREYRWCAVRDSYLVVLQEPGELVVWDAFLLDQDFQIERPRRVYRRGFNFLHLEHETSPRTVTQQRAQTNPEHKSLLGSMRDRVHNVFSCSQAEPDAENVQPSQDDRDSSSSLDIPLDTPTPMLDPSTHTNPLVAEPDHRDDNGNNQVERDNKVTPRDVSKHTFYIMNSQMKLKLYAHNERQMLQWITAFEKIKARSHYVGSNRFDSFAPIRLNVASQWLVDGRDYFWNLSRAISLATECIYIHGWWLSPELQMRRPNKDRYRLDRLLERKARAGVKIYIILYQEVSNRTTPTDSNYAKQRFTALHPNVMVQRSPSHFQTGTYYWAHHEKLCVIDHTIAFMGGLDMCFGRWDTPQHVLTDDSRDIWPGKDYSNPRQRDFYDLHKPHEDMYDRDKVPRMPWHDVAMQIIGQPARDLSRHFVQRWNWLLRIKNHSRVMPFLLPPPEFKESELIQMQLTGTCELQICRSAGPWSMGTLGRVEHSIQNAYLKAIQMSEHFVYIENQFFITSTVVNDVKIENKIGDALVHRIIQAHRSGTPWKCCILIPLLPGFTFPVDHSDASAIRIILECQNRTICRGPHSIFSRLRKEGIDPDQYISIFSLRNWAKLRNDDLTTEQVYIHGKVCIVDDRLAIIGSANINERSQRGDRDSELAAVIRDTDMIDCTMGGRPFQVGRFAHTLRVRLMREHLGIDVDALDEETFVPKECEDDVSNTKGSVPEGLGGSTIRGPVDRRQQGELSASGIVAVHSVVDLNQDTLVQRTGSTGRDTLNTELDNTGQEEMGGTGSTSYIVPTSEGEIIGAQCIGDDQKNNRASLQGLDQEEGENCHAKGVKSTDQTFTQNGVPYGVHGECPRTDEPRQGRSTNQLDRELTSKSQTTFRRDASKSMRKNWTLPTERPRIDVNGFEDPISDRFWKHMWLASAVHNTEIYRKVFHAVPDDLVTTWKQYKEFVSYHERLNKLAKDTSSVEPKTRVPSEPDRIDVPGQDSATPHDTISVAGTQRSKDGFDGSQVSASSQGPTSGTDTNQKTRKATKGPEPFEKWERDEMEKLLGELNGHLVLYPTRFLEGEDTANNFLFNADRLLPLPIYN